MGASGAGRDKRIAERIRADVMDLLLRGAIRDPDVQGAVVSAVDVTNDLSVARVWLRALEGDVDAARRKRLVSAMKRAGGFIRRELGRTLQVRRVPELRFEWDEGADRAARVEALLDEIAIEQRARKEDGQS
ncbi:30S ribosome-binding factor RbfA [Sandaracinus amylolyticus]|uniref:Ribosome-binding factor A n=1 Tax=Sandaracinus amylolyticus TaxID=927083 RepID=A0A0F6W362_9BACT|nr:30S ribosome-binding factor RbfA [Sandaracinus amylolyticus]AKF06242.1 Ribosome-binding factor A [Sandaracinus amylolyticus]